MTHAELVERAAKWLRNTRRCGVVLTEAGGGWEIPDAIGWRVGGRFSVLVECKASRADFLRDAKKAHRLHGDTMGVGRERVYMAPAGMLRADEIPAGWGLVEIGPTGRARIIVKPEPWPDASEIAYREIGFLYSAAWKAQNLARPASRLAADQFEAGQASEAPPA